MKLAELLDLMRSDIELKRRWFLERDTWFNRNVRVFVEPGTLAVMVYRVGHYSRELSTPVLRQLVRCAYMQAKVCVVLGFGIYVPSRLKVGKGFAIHNFSGIFLPPTTTGDNLIVFQGVTVGHLRGQGGKPPRLGSNVFLGAGCKVMGNITIGNNVVVGANSLVVNDVPDNCTVVGVPARVVSRDTSWMEEKLNGQGDHW